MSLQKPGLYTIVPLQEAPVRTKAFNTLQEFFRLWIVRNNQDIPNTDLEAGNLARSLCFYPVGYRPDIPYEYLNGYAVWFDRSFVETNPHLKRFLELIAHWQKPTVTIRRQDAWYQPFLAACLAQDFIDRQNPEGVDTYRYLHCTLIVNYLCDLLSSSIPWLTPASQLSDISFRFLALVEQHFLVQRRPKFYADLLHVSESNLFKRCRQDLERSPGEIIHLRVIKEAKYLLSQSLLPGKEVADQLNFNSYAYFCERFKEATTLTPQAFRKLNRYER